MSVFHRLLDGNGTKPFKDARGPGLRPAQVPGWAKAAAEMQRLSTARTIVLMGTIVNGLAMPAPRNLISWTESHMREFIADLGYAARALRKNPGFAAAAILLLALGIGANALIFSLVDGILLRPLPFRDPARLAAIWETTGWEPKGFACYRDVEVFDRQGRSFDGIAGWQWEEYTIAGRGGPRRSQGEAVTPRFFEILGVPSAQGRTFGPADLNRVPSVVLSDAGWKALFGGAPGAIGQALTLDGRAYTVLGIMPRGFEFYPRQVLFWTLLTPADVARQASAKFHGMGVVGRLRPGVSMASAEAEIAALRAALGRPTPTRSCMRAPWCAAYRRNSRGWRAEVCAPGCCCCSRPSRSCCSSPAPMSPICWPAAPWSAAAKSPFARRWARDADG